uniref:Uncharacterized protein n=1 Tax=Arundo donax TaxID=35708 RepID=A0A0A9EZY2_ARUDO
MPIPVTVQVACYPTSDYILFEQVVDFCDVQFHQISKDKVHCQGAKPSNACRPEKLLQKVDGKARERYHMGGINV